MFAYVGNCVKNIILELGKSEVVPERCFSKNVFFKYAANLQESTYAEGF